MNLRRRRLGAVALAGALALVGVAPTTGVDSAAVAATAQPTPERRPVDADTARREAGEILSQRRYQPARRPPGGGVAARIGRAVRRVLQPVGRALAWLARPVVAVVNWLWASVLGRALVVAVMAAAVALVVLVAARRRRATALARRYDGGLFAEDDDPGDLETAARRAAAAGDHALAVRLRFRAGLVRLHRQGHVGVRPSMTTREIGRVVRSRRFDDLGRTFDRVTYGRASAAADDDAAAEAGWRDVLAEVGSRR